ncbi:hypothetical protein H0H92_005062 [Tricholoma furcatifolium]|nr:hypothetical protein H0H92_005062 [Tricholoma furcatifolium]
MTEKSQPKQTQKKKKTIGDGDLPVASKRSEDEAAEPIGTVDIDWKGTDHDLNQQLVTAIFKDAKIKQGLFPPPGPNASTKGGSGKTKTEFYWALCEELFAEHPKYQEAFLIATNLKGKKLQLMWTDKIKN